MHGELFEREVDLQSYPLTFSQRALQRDLRRDYMVVLLHPYPREHGRSRSGRFTPDMGNTEDCRASKQIIIHIINHRKWTFLRL